MQIICHLSLEWWWWFATAQISIKSDFSDLIPNVMCISIRVRNPDRISTPAELRSRLKPKNRRGQLVWFTWPNWTKPEFSYQWYFGNTNPGSVVDGLKSHLRWELWYDRTIYGLVYLPTNYSLLLPKIEALLLSYTGTFHTWNNKWFVEIFLKKISEIDRNLE